MERDLHILDSGSKRGESKLDLVFVSSHFTDIHIIMLPSTAGADHDIQLVSIPQWSDWSRIREWVQIDYLQLDNALAQIDWSSFFSDCVFTDEYAERFTNWLLAAIQMCTIRRQRFKLARLPIHIIKLLHAKKKAWRLAKRSSSNAAYKEACNKSRASIRQFKRNQKQRILYSKNTKQFFFMCVINWRITTARLTLTWEVLVFPVGKQQKFLYQSFQAISHRLYVWIRLYTPRIWNRVSRYYHC